MWEQNVDVSGIWYLAGVILFHHQGPEKHYNVNKIIVVMERRH